MEPYNEQIAPEIIQAIIAEASARGLTVNDYLARLLTLARERNGELALAGEPGFTAAQSLTPYELVEDVIGTEDSSLPEDPDSPPHRPPMYYFVAEKLRKQGLKIP